MKALIIKDLMLLKSQKNSGGILFALFIIFAITYSNPAFVIAYSAIVFSIISLNTIAFDEHENANAYLFTFPVKRATYAKEKYALSGIVLTGSMVMISLITLLSTVIRTKTITGAYFFEWKVSVALSIMLVVPLLAVTIQVQLKYGAEKGRIVLFIFALIIVIGSYLLDKSGNLSQISPVGQMKEIYRNGITIQKGLAGAALCIIITAISMTISIKIMKNKEY